MSEKNGLRIFFKYVGQMIFIILCGSSALAYGEEATTVQPPLKPKVERVAGNYIVDKIDAIEDSVGSLKARAFAIEFKSEVPSGHFDRIRLEANHIHMGVKVGDKLRISAEVGEEKNGVVEATQVLLFLPGAGPGAASAVPVWMLSRKNSGSDLNGARYLEMHSPNTDFLVL